MFSHTHFLSLKDKKSKEKKEKDVTEISGASLLIELSNNDFRLSFFKCFNVKVHLKKRK